MEWAAQRQKLVAENIANADTPGYRAKDVAPFGSMVGSSSKLSMAQTSPGHMGGAITSGRFAVIAAETWSDTISGNNVVLEEQMLKAADTRGTHDLATTVYQKSMNMLSSVMRRE